ncbi:SDR family NAD(P)-dependent oxidoreductase [Diaphorobacter caeni]|uniref:SDR family NAD(P)-dependent oxidoreductase n=1 Tax=Diaphorobacter caeni TaxID=2784387 RepID=UPI00188ECD17|nr:SDR family oxidoreductase [Diaphorobacter caeni]MBF5005903.1 SDR family oxidoreductase [Diaphorobacter caeni]
MNTAFENQVVLVTGATAGIGRAAAIAFARAGARLVVSGRNEAAGAQLQAELQGLGAQAHFVRADVADEAQVAHLVDQCVQRFGRLDAAVNSAGLEGARGSIMEQTVENYTAAFNANALGTFLCLKHEMRVMSAQKSGSIVNLSSTMGSRGNALAPMYVASKHAIEGFTKSVALEACQHGVRVNAVAPGPIATEMLDRIAGGAQNIPMVASTIPMNRIGTPDEVADAILYLASKHASYITGQILHVNGGKTAM